MDRLHHTDPNLRSPDCPIDSAALLYFDLETTGLHPERGAAVTEAAVLDDGGLRLDWRRDSSNSEFGDVLPRLSELLAAGVVVGHNVEFDFGFLAYEAARRDMKGPNVRYIDTLALSHELHGERSDHRLDALVQAYDLEIQGNLHTAATDVRATRQLLFQLTEQADLRTLENAGLSQLDWSTV